MKTITQSIFEQEIAFWVNVHSTLVLSQTAFHTPALMQMTRVHISLAHTYMIRVALEERATLAKMAESRE